MYREIKYFANGYTAIGFVNYIVSNLQNIQKVYQIHHPAKKYQQELFKQLRQYYLEIYPVETVLNPIFPNQIDGLIIREMSIAFISDQVELNGIPADKIQTISSGKLIADHQSDQINQLLCEARILMKRGLAIHDKLEEVYYTKMDFSKADMLAESVIADILQSRSQSSQPSIVYERLFSTNSGKGFANEVASLIYPLQKRIFLKGRAGTGKSVFMRRILEACQVQGYSVEMYRCSFDPKSIDMLIVRELSFCIFDSTDPHAFHPDRPTDQVIDLYELAVEKGTDEKFAHRIIPLQERYKESLKCGLEKMKEVAQHKKEEEKALEYETILTTESVLEKCIFK